MSIKIFDVLGKEVATLIDNMHQNPGFKSVRWNGLNKDGKLVVSECISFQLKQKISIKLENDYDKINYLLC